MNQLRFPVSKLDYEYDCIFTSDVLILCSSLQINEFVLDMMCIQSQAIFALRCNGACSEDTRDIAIIDWVTFVYTDYHEVSLILNR